MSRSRSQDQRIRSDEHG